MTITKLDAKLLDALIRRHVTFTSKGRRWMAALEAA